MFDKMFAKKFGYESYGKIIKIENYFPLLTHPWLPMKKICIEYIVHDQTYQHVQIIYNVLKKYEKTMQVGNWIRIRIHKSKPEYAYINEYDKAEYDL